MFCEFVGREKLIAKLEGIFYKHIYNNGSQIRYPIDFEDGTRLRGRYILRVTEDNKDIFFSGRYKFGANSVYIYEALDAILKFLETENKDIEKGIDEIVDMLEILD